MAISEGYVGDVLLTDTSQAAHRIDKRAQTVVVGGGGRYQECAARGHVFTGANQAATTTTVGLATTYTGLALSNPAGSSVNLVLLQVGISVAGAPAALSQLGLMAGYTAAGVVTHTTALIANCSLWGLNATSAAGKIDAAATLTATPVVVMSFATTPITGATAQVVTPPVTGVFADINGAIVLQAGAHVAIYTSTVLSIIGSFTWAEIPV